MTHIGGKLLASPTGDHLLGTLPSTPRNNYLSSISASPTSDSSYHQHVVNGSTVIIQNNVRTLFTPETNVVRSNPPGWPNLPVDTPPERSELLLQYCHHKNLLVWGFGSCSGSLSTACDWLGQCLVSRITAY